jgi:hypothetical protein
MGWGRASGRYLLAFWWFALIGVHCGGIAETEITYREISLDVCVGFLGLNGLVGLYFGRIYWHNGHLHRLARHVHWLRVLNGEASGDLQNDPFILAAERTAIRTMCAMWLVLFMLPAAMLIFWGYPGQGIVWYLGWLDGFTLPFQLALRQALWQHIAALHVEQARLLCLLTHKLSCPALVAEFHTGREIVLETTALFVDRVLTIATVFMLGIIATSISGFAINITTNSGIAYFLGGCAVRSQRLPLCVCAPLIGSRVVPRSFGTFIALTTAKMLFHVANVNAAFERLEAATYARVFHTEAHRAAYLQRFSAAAQVRPASLV